MVEKQEITDFSQLYRVNGLNKFITGRGKSTVKVGDLTFVVDKKFQVVERIGKGAYGQVVKAIDLSQEEEVFKNCAIKKIEEVFEHATYSKRCLRELKILRLLDHKNVIDSINKLR